MSDEVSATNDKLSALEPKIWKPEGIFGQIFGIIDFFTAEGTTREPYPTRFECRLA
jgi:hypothetical protein